MRLRNMVEDLFVVSNLEDAAFCVRPETVQVAQILSEVVGAYERKAQQKHVSLTPSLSVPCELLGDASLLRRVFENVLDNSLRYTPADGHVRVAAKLGVLLEISISNTGPPVPLSERERIFEKFARGSSESQSLGNAGLGLYFCKRAIEAHGGHIKVLETPEWPTSFVIELPPNSAPHSQPH
jgi:signal transduction histidine kinase